MQDFSALMGDAVEGDGLRDLEMVVPETHLLPSHETHLLQSHGLRDLKLGAPEEEASMTEIKLELVTANERLQVCVCVCV